MSTLIIYSLFNFWTPIYNIFMKQKERKPSVSRKLLHIVLDQQVLDNLIRCYTFLNTEGEKNLSEQELTAISNVLSRILVANSRKQDTAALYGY